MLNVTYANSATNQTYDTYAINWISSEGQKDAILKAASKLGVSAGAIAGAMAEECTSIRANLAEFAKQTWMDEIALKHNLGLESNISVRSTPMTKARSNISVRSTPMTKARIGC